MTARILLVEDDPTTCAFLATAARGIPAEVDQAPDCATALRLAGSLDRHDLWLIDANLPDGDGAELLARLRASGLRAPALAHTATRDPDALEALRVAGFREVLVKPMPVAALQAAARAALALRVREAPASISAEPGAPAVWDDASALAALDGERAHVDALRKLFLDELPAIHDGVERAARDGDGAALRGALHRLRASCGFVGAARLAEAVAGLHDDPMSEPALAQFGRAVQATLSSAPSGTRA